MMLMEELLLCKLLLDYNRIHKIIRMGLKQKYPKDRLKIMLSLSLELDSNVQMEKKTKDQQFNFSKKCLKLPLKN
jgi:hypothetical protein